MPLQVIQTPRQEQLILELIGTLDENGQLPSVQSYAAVRLDFRRMESINSIGIRHFILWGDQHRAVPQILLENCPPILVKNFSIIQNLLKSNMVVQSFFVPYYSEETSERNDVLFVRHRDFTQEGKVHWPQVKDSEGHPMELDIAPQSYLRFLAP